MLSSSSRSELHRRRGPCRIVFTSEKVESRHVFREREQPVDVSGSNESIFRYSDTANVGKSLLDGDKDHLLNQTRSELMKQE